MSERFLCTSDGKKVCLDTAGNLLTERVAEEVPGNSGDLSQLHEADLEYPLDPDERYIRLQFEIINDPPEGSNPYEDAVQYDRAMLVGWCTLMEQSGLLCPECPIRQFLSNPR